MADEAFKIGHLVSGGLITTYFCPSRCRHCLYKCGPFRQRGQITKERAVHCFEKANALGTASMHVGGGEPLVFPDNLVSVLEAASGAGVSIDYVETNCAWFRDEAQACRLLERLAQKGLTCLLVSISPFHMEYIPFARVKGVMAACRKTGIRIFPWMDTFIHDLEQFDPDRPHSFETVLDRFGSQYLDGILDRYWVHPGGRAIEAFRPVTEENSLEDILENSERSCAGRLSDTSHFHMDLYGKFIPGLCSGLGISIDDLGQPLSKKTYPLMTVLVESGIRGLYDRAVRHHGYRPSKKGFVSKCDLCNDIRSHLFFSGQDFNELTPGGYYREKTT